MRCISLVAIVLCIAYVGLAAEPRGLPIAPLPPFSCRPYEVLPDEKTPTDVNKLQPHHIKAVIAFGDSMTAAFGAKAGKLLSEPLVPREDRLASYSGGGGSMQYTIPNYIAVYNRNVQGGAIGTTLPLDDKVINGHHHEPFLHDNIRLNAALSGGVVQDIPDMIDYVVTQLKTTFNQSVDFENDWKLATVLIGANNMCGACHNSSSDQPAAYQQALNDALQQMYEQIPRLRVNLLPMFNIAQVREWAMTDKYCTRMWDTIAESECSCVTKKGTTLQNLELVNQAAIAYRNITEVVAKQWAQKNLTTFSVTYQPFSANVKIVNAALTSDFDCFHPSWITHAWLSVGLWNSMMLPPSQKPTNGTMYLLEGAPFICPDRHTYLQ